MRSLHDASEAARRIGICVLQMHKLMQRYTNGGIAIRGLLQERLNSIAALLRGASHIEA
jgi:hypothetical protein